MKSIPFTCEVITPIFLTGVDGKTPELRVPSIKGALRFWWRAMHGHLPIDDIGEVQKGLRSLETEIFGGGGDKARISSFEIRKISDAISFSMEKPLPHHTGNRNCNYINSQNSCEGRRSPRDQGLCKKGSETLAISGGTFSISFTGGNLELVKSLFVLTCLLGGFGKRSRRGFGCVEIKDFSMPSTLNEIMDHLNLFSDHYQLDNVVNPPSICMKPTSTFYAQYPYIESIQIGETVYPDYESLLLKIGEATHDFKNKNDHSLGYAEKGDRLASPVYVSVLKKGLKDYRAIITTLHMATKDDKFKVNRQKQENFKNAIL